MDMEPLGNNIIVQIDTVETKTAGGLYIPKIAQTQAQLYTVVKIGVHVKDIEVGNKIFFNKRVGTALNIQGIDYLIISRDEVLAVCR